MSLSAWEIEHEPSIKHQTRWQIEMDGDSLLMMETHMLNSHAEHQSACWSHTWECLYPADPGTAELSAGTFSRKAKGRFGGGPRSKLQQSVLRALCFLWKQAFSGKLQI